MAERRFRFALKTSSTPPACSACLQHRLLRSRAASPSTPRCAGKIAEIIEAQTN
jgi:hypothetical protein